MQEKIIVTKMLCMLTNAIRKCYFKSPIKQEVENVSGTHGWIIAYLSDHTEENIYQRDLEREFGIGRSTTSKMLAKMEDAGLVRRERVFMDDRLKKIVLTDKSKELAFKIRMDNLKTEQKILDGFSEDEVERLEGYLQRMLQNLAT